MDNLLCSKRMRLDEVLAKIKGIHFFISSITGITKNKKSKPKKRKRTDEPNTDCQDASPSTQEELEKVEDTSASLFNRGIAYFIAYTPSETCSQQQIFSALHEEEMACEIATIKTQIRNTGSEDATEHLYQELCQVLKDHNNPVIQSLVDTSNHFCFARSLAECFPTENDPQIQRMFNLGQAPMPNSANIRIWPSHIYVVNEVDFGHKLQRAKEKMSGEDHVRIGIIRPNIDHPDNLRAVRVAMEAPNDVIATINRIKNAMKSLGHALYRGQIFAKAPDSKYTYLRMASVKDYLNKLLMNETLRDGIVNNFFKIQTLLSADSCEIVEQLKIDLDLIEVLNGECFSISQRKFIPSPISDNDIGLISPRMFFAYESAADPDPLYFKQSVENSFPNEKTKANFLNKFYQCFMAGRMPHKCRKLVVCGPKDSGKTTWASLFLAVIDRIYIASLTKEKTFSAMMITEETQLVLLDEWASDTLQSDTAKTVLQGGYMIKSVKHGAPVSIDNRAPFYITTNEVPDFGEDNENVQRRIKVFETMSLPNTVMNVDLWLQEHAMDCIAWIASEINRLIHHVDVEERWYEPQPPPVKDAVSLSGKLAKRGMGLFDSEKVVALTYDDVTGAPPATLSGEDGPNPLIHKNFAEKAKSFFEQRQKELDEEDQREKELQAWANNEHIETTQDKIDLNKDINSEEFHRLINRQLNIEFNVNLKPTLVHSFARVQGGYKNKPCPMYDAWCIVTGDVREEFDFFLFFRRYPGAMEKVEQIREKLNVRLFPDRDPVAVSRKRFAKEDAGEELQSSLEERRDVFNFFKTWWTKFNGP